MHSSEAISVYYQDGKESISGSTKKEKAELVCSLENAYYSLEEAAGWLLIALQLAITITNREDRGNNEVVLSYIKNY